MLKQKVWYLLILGLLLLPVSAFAAPRLTIAPEGSDGSTFVLRGEQMDGVTALEIKIGFNESTARNPKVTLGALAGGMMSAVNPTNPIRMALVGTRPLAGSGVIATISFERAGAGPAMISSVIGSGIDSNSRPIAMAFGMTNPTVPAPESGSKGGGNPPATDTTTDTTTYTPPPPSSGTLRTGGTLTMPDQEGQATAQSSRDDANRSSHPDTEHQLQRRESVPAPEEERVPAEKKEAKPSVTQPVALVSVLERFRQFQGEKTVESLTALFKQDAGSRVSQIPPIAVADGKGTVTLAIAMSTGDRAPNFAFSAARYVSLHRSTDGWEIEVTPDRGVVRAGVTMLYENQVQEIPLTVTPRLDLTGGNKRQVTEGDFKRFLNDRGTPAAPKYDLNKDGRRDFIDDYIYTANYLLQLEKQAAKKKGSKQP